MQVSPSTPVWRGHHITSKLQRLRRAGSILAVEDRPAFKRVDASPVAYDDGAWLRPLA